jgi:hypothetical protein
VIGTPNHASQSFANLSLSGCSSRTMHLATTSGSFPALSLIASFVATADAAPQENQQTMRVMPSSSSSERDRQ